MTNYMFEYHTERGTRTTRVRAVDSMDAFDMFRADHPHALIAHIWIELFEGGGL